MNPSKELPDKKFLDKLLWIIEIFQQLNHSKFQLHMEDYLMGFFSKIVSVVKITKNLLDEETESEIQELSMHMQQAVKEATDVMESAAELKEEVEEVIDETMLVAALAAAILQRFWGSQDPEEKEADTRGLLPAAVERFVEKGIERL